MQTKPFTTLYTFMKGAGGNHIITFNINTITDITIILMTLMSSLKFPSIAVERCALSSLYFYFERIEVVIFSQTDTDIREAQTELSCSKSNSLSKTTLAVVLQEQQSVGHIA